MTLDLLSREYRDKLNEVFKDNIRFTAEDAKKMVMALSEIYFDEVVRDGATKIPNVGSIKVKMVKGRAGRNPATGEAMIFADSHKPKFTPSKGLKEAVTEKFDA